MKRCPENEENNGFITFKVLVQLQVSEEKGRFVMNESSLTVYVKGIWCVTSSQVPGNDSHFQNCHHSTQQLHEE